MFVRIIEKELVEIFGVKVCVTLQHLAPHLIPFQDHYPC